MRPPVLHRSPARWGPRVPAAPVEGLTTRSRRPVRPALSIEGARKRYGDVTALDGVDLEIRPGEVCALLGPNGSGKTTLISIAAGLRTADAGRVRVGGQDVTTRGREARRRLGLVGQDVALYPVTTVRQNLRFLGELAGVGRRALEPRIEEVADALDLGHCLDRPLASLSGGEARRVHVAGGLVHRPALLLLDEPTAGVDVGTRGRLLDVVRRLAADGTAVCYSTHYLAEVEALQPTAVVILDHGRVLARGSVDELVRHHGDPFAELTFDGPVPAVTAAAGTRPEPVAGGVRLFSPRPAEAVADVLRHLAPSARLRSVEVTRPGLESVFVALTGRRVATPTGGGPDASAC
jgi:ABC-2 type transport system ATP-binding protein